ncbi:hypothetical protein [Enterococcus sp. DIV0187]
MEEKQQPSRCVAGSSLTPTQIKQMEKEMTRLRQENEILKTAMAAIFTK